MDNFNLTSLRTDETSIEECICLLCNSDASVHHFTEYTLINRIGYGSFYNNIYLDKKNNIIKKICYNDSGMKKILSEINTLTYIIKNNINFKIPKIYNFYNNGYDMEYLNEYISLYKIYKELTIKNREFLLNNIYEELKNLHSFNKIIISKEDYIKNLKIETFIKIIERYNTIKPFLINYVNINSINGIKVYSFDKILEMINLLINEYIEKKKEYYYVPIHGDCQFNNIMYNKKNKNICFIDPRGYYGEQVIYGIEEYDYAKILFALSGYDEFDNREINNLDIQNNNINILLDILDEHIFEQKNLSILIMVTIWMGNSSCFIGNTNKMIYSYFISLYVGTIILNKFINVSSVKHE